MMAAVSRGVLVIVSSPSGAGKTTLTRRLLAEFGPQLEFSTYGKSGQRICNLFSHLGGVADDITVIRSMWSEQINHDTAHMFLNTGSIVPGRPSMGSWLLYGLGAQRDERVSTFNDVFDGTRSMRCIRIG